MAPAGAGDFWLTADEWCGQFIIGTSQPHLRKINPDFHDESDPSRMAVGYHFINALGQQVGSFMHYTSMRSVPPGQGPFAQAFSVTSAHLSVPFPPSEAAAPSLRRRSEHQSRRWLCLITVQVHFVTLVLEKHSFLFLFLLQGYQEKNKFIAAQGKCSVIPVALCLLSGGSWGEVNLLCEALPV